MRFGVVGTGYWASEVHAAGIAAHEEAELVGVWGRDPAKAATFADRLGVAAFEEFDQLLAEVDALTLAVPPQVQSELALRAARAGKHLLLEKPITSDLSAAERLVQAVDAAGVSTVVFFTQRFLTAWEDWLDGLRESELLGGHVDWLASLRTPDNPFASSQWRKEDGALWDVGPHALSILLPALGPVVDVSGARGVGDLVHLVLTHQSGATSTMSLSLTMPPAAIRVGVDVYDAQGWRSQPDTERDVAKCYGRAVSELHACVQEGRTDHRVDVRFGRDVVEVLERCERVLTPRSAPPRG